ncbi:hypothetical protein [Priestia aryabhattai]
MIKAMKNVTLVISNFSDYIEGLSNFNSSFATSTRTRDEKKKLIEKIIKFEERKEKLQRRDAHLFEQKEQREMLLANISDVQKVLNSLENNRKELAIDPLTQKIDHQQLFSNAPHNKEDIQAKIKEFEDIIKEYEDKLSALDKFIESETFLLKRDAFEFKKELSKKENQRALYGARAQSIRLNRSLTAPTSFEVAAEGFKTKVLDLLELMPEKPTGDEIVFICEEDGIYNCVILLDDDKFVVSINSTNKSIRISVIDDVETNQLTILGEGHSFLNIAWAKDIKLSRFTYDGKEWFDDTDIEKFGTDLIIALYRKMNVCGNLTPEQAREIRDETRCSKISEVLAKLARDTEEAFIKNYKSLTEV